MIAAKYNKAIVEREFITGLATETATDIYQVISGKPEVDIAGFASFLSGNPFSVINAGAGVRLEMRFPLGLRYMDMKKDYRTGKPKSNYVPVYNKIVWGFIYGYLYKQLIYGYSQSFNEAVTSRLTNSGLKEI